jgi:hypothetical protein
MFYGFRVFKISENFRFNFFLIVLCRKFKIGFWKFSKIFKFSDISNIRRFLIFYKCSFFLHFRKDLVFWIFVTCGIILFSDEDVWEVRTTDLLSNFVSQVKH